MNITHKKLVLDVNRAESYELTEAHRGDKLTRFIDVTITASNEVIELTQSMNAYINATIDDIIVASDVEAVIDTNKNIIVVELTDYMLAIPGVLKVDLLITENDEIITAETFKVRVKNSVINEQSKFAPAGSTIEEQIKNKADRSTTLAGYGIDDAYTKNQVNEKFNNEFVEVEKISNKVNATNEITDESENYPSVAFLNGYYYTYGEVDDLLAEKMDAPEQGSGDFITDDTSVNTKAFEYQRLGDFVFLTVNFTLSEKITASRNITFSGLPFANKTMTSILFLAASNSQCSISIGSYSTTLKLTTPSVLNAGARMATTLCYKINN